jgi:hypothetical protein
MRLTWCTLEDVDLSLLTLRWRTVLLKGSITVGLLLFSLKFVVRDKNGSRVVNCDEGD